MKTDKELLELAAKAAGISRQWDGSLVDRGFPDKVWNPLKDDGDALRLAVKLNIAYQLLFTRAVHRHMKEQGGYDLYAATRRAIVRAAAAIGEKL